MRPVCASDLPNVVEQPRASRERFEMSLAGKYEVTSFASQPQHSTHANVQQHKY